jgi:hypothetical protein
MTEILKATMKTMQISRIFIIILLLNEITYDFFSLIIDFDDDESSDEES